MESPPAEERVGCGFRGFSNDPAASRRNAYLSSSTHLSGCHLWHARSSSRVCRPEDIHATETESETKLGLVLSTRRTSSMLTATIDDWLIILPTLLSIALIGPSHRRSYPFSKERRHWLNNDRCRDVACRRAHLGRGPQRD
jgi:hypothetical protein